MARRQAVLVSVAMILACSGGRAQAAHKGCDHCGCRQATKKVCRLVCETKEEKKIQFCCECEDFCVSGPSRKCGERCHIDSCGKKCCHDVYQPTCVKVHTRKKLIKREIVKEVPSYKWVVEEICCGCGHCLDKTEEPAGPDDAPPAPAAQALGEHFHTATGFLAAKRIIRVQR